MCFDLDSRPPIAPIAGGALEAERLVLTGPDGNRFLAFRARAAEPTGAGIVILPDVRGLHPFYEELALRFAEVGVDALAIDYFGRTAGTESHATTTSSTCRTSSGRPGPACRPTSGRRPRTCGRRTTARVRSLFTVGFCFGGRLRS